ncbi:MAG TPA: ABC transporter permease, partial [Thermoanaerobaculia bacterium]|nr:ABC transporter permease [Thermoanaerobaculia bacterium]
MNWFAQVAALISFNLRTLPTRKGSATAAIFGIAGVVAVLVGVLSIGEGFRHAMTVAGSPDTAIVLRGGAATEMTSILLRDDTNIVANAPGVAKADGKPLVSPELFVIVNLPMRDGGSDANVPLRGVESQAFRVHDEIRIVEGRQFRWGSNEVIVGRNALRQFEGVEMGSNLKFGTNYWKVVGIFEAGGSVAESELWTDAAVLSPAYRRGASYQSALVRLASPGNFQQFKDALTADPRLNVKVVRETDYYAEQSRVMRGLITGLAFIVSLLMGLGAIFGALNTMYTAVAARSREIATLEAIGFRGSPVVLSVLAEAVVLALLGGAIGALGAWLAFDGYRAATMNFQSFSQVAFAFEVNSRLIVPAILYALFIGIVGGFFPAMRAVKIPVSMALRER